jgi:hypothetical protein
MTFQPGHTFSPGRRHGSRNKRTEEIFNRLENRGDLDPADLLSTIVTNPQEQQELRIQAAGLLMPYKYGKHGSIPPLRYIDEPVQLPEPLTIEQANKNIAYISNLKAQGLIDLDFANSLIADNTTIANNLIAEEELRFKINPPETRDTTIRIEGGLPQLPGCENLIMPVLNGSSVREQLLTAPTDVIPPDDGTNQVPSDAATEFNPTPGELKAQGPHPLQEHHFRDPAPEDPRKNSTNGGGEPCV